MQRFIDVKQLYIAVFLLVAMSAIASTAVVLAVARQSKAYDGNNNFGFTKLLAVQRHHVESTHVYTYHQEGLKPGGGMWVVDLADINVEMKKILDSSQGQVAIGAAEAFKRRAVI